MSDPDIKQKMRDGLDDALADGMTTLFKMLSANELEDSEDALHRFAVGIERLMANYRRALQAIDAAPGE